MPVAHMDALGENLIGQELGGPRTAETDEARAQWIQRLQDAGDEISLGGELGSTSPSASVQSSAVRRMAQASDSVAETPGAAAMDEGEGADSLAQYLGSLRTQESQVNAIFRILRAAIPPAPKYRSAHCGCCGEEVSPVEQFEICGFTNAALHAGGCGTMYRATAVEQ